MQKSGTGRSVPQYPIDSVDRALRLLLLFRDRRELRLSDARDVLGVGQSTAHRLLAMLVYHGFADQDPGSRAYRAGPTLVELGLSVVNRMDLRVAARPFLSSMAEETGETTHLAVLEHERVRFVDEVESDQMLRVAGRTGRALPAYATSIGKAMLAQLPDEQITGLYPEEDLAEVTTRTMTSRTDLLKELARVREDGYAVNAEESEDGVTSVAVAIAPRAGLVVGGLSIATPLTRSSGAKRTRHVGILLTAAEQLTAALAGSAVKN